MRVLVVCLLVLLPGCGEGEPEAPQPTRVVVAAFYPLAWATERVAASSVEVVNLTQPGAEPHDLELSSRDIEQIRDASLVVYVGGGFQPAVADAVRDRAGPSLDVLDGDGDPHVWLDPIRFARTVQEIASRVAGSGSGGDVIRELDRLDREYRSGLERCERRAIVTTHRAFGRLASRYGLTQVSLAGSSPEAEPGPRDLERLVERARRSGATTVFAEPLASSRVAETVAREAGLDVAVLDPVEGLTEERLAAGEDYLSVMHDNLAALRKALGCR